MRLWTCSTRTRWPRSSQREIRASCCRCRLLFYEKLGFHRVFQDSAENPTYAGVRRGGAELHLQWHDSSAWAQAGDRPTYRFVVADVDELLLELRASGPLDIDELGNTPWGTREFHVRDPDGNGLQFYRDLF